MSVLLVVASMVYVLTWVFALPAQLVTKRLFNALYPELLGLEDLLGQQSNDWNVAVSDRLSAPDYSVLSLLVHYPSVLIHSVVLRRDQFGGHIMIWTSAFVLSLVAILVG